MIVWDHNILRKIWAQYKKSSPTSHNIFNVHGYFQVWQLKSFFFFFTALVGTLKAAKKKKIVTYAGELLLQGVHDDVDIILLVDEE